VTHADAVLRLESELRALLARLDSQETDGETIDEAARRCRAAFELACPVDSVSGPELARSRQLVALLSQVASRDLARTSRRLRLARAARRALSGQAEVPRLGNSCDCAG
jgi:hypothetical protein